MTLPEFLLLRTHLIEKNTWMTTLLYISFHAINKHVIIDIVPKTKTTTASYLYTQINFEISFYISFVKWMDSNKANHCIQSGDCNRTWDPSYTIIGTNDTHTELAPQHKASPWKIHTLKPGGGNTYFTLTLHQIFGLVFPFSHRLNTQFKFKWKEYRQRTSHKTLFLLFANFYYFFSRCYRIVGCENFLTFICDRRFSVCLVLTVQGYQSVNCTLSVQFGRVHLSKSTAFFSTSLMPYIGFLFLGFFILSHLK